MPPSTLPVEYRSSLLRSTIALLGVVAFTALGVYLLTVGGGLRTTIGIVTIAFFGVLGLPALAWRAMNRPVMVRLVEDGVELHQRPFVPWSELEAVEARTVAGARMVVFLLRAGAVKRLTAGDATGASAMRNDTRVIGRDAVAISPGVEGGPRRLAEEIQAHLDRVRAEHPPAD